MAPVVIGELEVQPAPPPPEPTAPMPTAVPPGPAERDAALEFDLRRIAARHERLHAD
jgi:hypothetical protein